MIFVSIEQKIYLMQFMNLCNLVEDLVVQASEKVSLIILIIDINLFNIKFKSNYIIKFIVLKYKYKLVK